MKPWIYQLSNFLAQAMPRGAYDDTPSAPQTPSTSDHAMSFSDLQKGLRTQLNGDNQDRHYRHLLWIVICVGVLFAILLNLRQRRKNGGPPDSTSALARELTRTFRFPLTDRLFLWWVARSAKTPMAALLISEELFTQNLTQWTRQPTFGPLRNWGAARLAKLQPLLFAPSAVV